MARPAHPDRLGWKRRLGLSARKARKASRVTRGHKDLRALRALRARRENPDLQDRPVLPGPLAQTARWVLQVQLEPRDRQDLPDRRAQKVGSDQRARPDLRATLAALRPFCASLLSDALLGRGASRNAGKTSTL